MLLSITHLQIICFNLIFLIIIHIDSDKYIGPYTEPYTKVLFHLNQKKKKIEF